MRKLFDIFRSSEVFFFLSGIGTNVFNYAFHVLTAYFLARAAYGELSVMLSFLMLLTVPVVGVQTSLTKHFPEVEFAFESLWAFFRHVFVVLGILGAIAFPVFYIGFVTVFDFFPLSLDLYIVLYVTWLALIGLALERGYLQYQNYFRGLGLHMLAESIMKLLFLVLLVFVGTKAYLGGSALTPFLGALFVLLWTYFWLLGRTNFSSKVVAPSEKKKAFWKDTAFMSCSQLVLTGFISLDLLLVNHFFPGFTADYSVASKIGQLLFMILFLLVQIDFSHGANQDASSQSKFTNTHKWILAAVICVGGLGFFAFAPEFVVWIIFGSKYLPAAPYLLLYGFGMIGLAGGQYLIHKMMLKKHYRFVWFGFASLILMIGGSFVFSSSVWALLTLFVSIIWGLFVALLLDSFSPAFRNIENTQYKP